MATTEDWVAGLGTAAVLLGGFLLNRALAIVRPRTPSSPLGAAGMLGLYATHKGSVVGEVVGLATDRLILRQGGVHKAVPLAQARLRDGDVALEGDIDWTAAEEQGRSWAGAAESGDGPAVADGGPKGP